MTPSLPRDLLTAAEQKANQKRQTIYSVLVWSFTGIALIAAFIVFGIVVASHAYEKGVQVERERQANTPKRAASVPVTPVDIYKGMDCVTLARETADKAYRQCRMEKVKPKGVPG